MWVLWGISVCLIRREVGDAYHQQVHTKGWWRGETDKKEGLWQEEEKLAVQIQGNNTTGYEPFEVFTLFARAPRGRDGEGLPAPVLVT